MSSETTRSSVLSRMLLSLLSLARSAFSVRSSEAWAESLVVLCKEPSPQAPTKERAAKKWANASVEGEKVSGAMPTRER